MSPIFSRRHAATILGAVLIGAGAIHSPPLMAQTGRVKNVRPPQRPLAFEHVTVVPMTESGAVMRDATVVVENERITALQGPGPRGARRIDGRGKWLMPGLADMHVHLPSDEQLPRPPKYPYEGLTEIFSTQDMMTPFIANGVTQIMDMSAFGSSFGQRIAIERGDVLGPNLALAAPIHGGRTEGRVF